MNCNNDRCEFNACVCLGVVISIVVGALIGVLFAFSLIPAILTIVWIIFGLAVLTLIFIFAGTLLSANTRSRELIKCSKRNIICLLAGTIGTIISSIIALSISLVVTTFVSGIIAILAFFFTTMIIGIIAYISCIACELPEN